MLRGPERLTRYSSPSSAWRKHRGGTKSEWLQGKDGKAAAPASWLRRRRPLLGKAEKGGGRVRRGGSAKRNAQRLRTCPARDPALVQWLRVTAPSPRRYAARIWRWSCRPIRVRVRVRGADLEVVLGRQRRRVVRCARAAPGTEPCSRVSLSFQAQRGPERACRGALHSFYLQILPHAGKVDESLAHAATRQERRRTHAAHLHRRAGTAEGAIASSRVFRVRGKIRGRRK